MTYNNLPFQFIERRDLLAKTFGDKHLPTYHGCRTKKSLEYIKEHGFIRPFTNYVEYIRQLITFIEKMNIKEYETRELIRKIIRFSNIIRFKDTTATVYITTIKEHCCGWAKNYPEIIINYVIEFIELNNKFTEEQRRYYRKRIYNALDEMYGKPICIELNITYPVEDTDINLHTTYIRPEWIKDVYFC